MNNSLLKSQINWNVWLPPLAFLVFLILEKELFGTYFSSWIYGLVLFFYGILYSLRYRLWHPAVILCLAGITLWHYTLAAHFNACLSMLHQMGIPVDPIAVKSPFHMGLWFVNLLIFLVTLPLFGPVPAKAFKLELSAKKLFRMAATTVSSTSDGFTSRPLHAGKTEFSKEQLTGFALYLSGQTVVFPVFTDSGIYLTFSMGKSPLSGTDPSAFSYLLFNPAGNISVNISERDYRQFRKTYSFDRLCESLGDVFKRFLLYYSSAQESKILTELAASKEYKS